MFLRKKGATQRFRFDEILSCLQKSLRRCDIPLALDMAYEFEPDYIKALQSRLMQNCCEDCPNLYLINDIASVRPTMKNLIGFIPAICNHIKCRDGMYGLRIVCEKDFCFDIPIITRNELYPTDEPIEPTRKKMCEKSKRLKNKADKLGKIDKDGNVVSAPNVIHSPQQLKALPSQQQSQQQQSHSSPSLQPSTFSLSDNDHSSPSSSLSDYSSDEIITITDTSNMPTLFSSTDHFIVNGKSPDLLHLLHIAWTHICAQRELEFISYFQPLFPHIKLKSLYTKVKKHITFLVMLCVFISCPFMNEKYTVNNKIYEKDHTFDPNLILPLYVYDKHVATSPPAQKNYAFFIDNCIIRPRRKETDIERQGKKLYITTNKGCGDSIRPITKGEIIPSSNVKLIQAQLITGKHKPHVYYMSVDENDDIVDGTLSKRIVNTFVRDIVTSHNYKLIDIVDNRFISYERDRFQMLEDMYALYCDEGYKYILKGPFKTVDEIESQLLSDRLKNDLLSLSIKIESNIAVLNDKTYYKTTNLIPIYPLNVTTESSKLESNVKIYAGNKHVFEHKYIGFLYSNDDQKRHSMHMTLFLSLAFRKIIGTNDTCTRNLLLVDGEVYTIDDPALFKQTPLMYKSNVPKSFVHAYEQQLHTYFDDILEEIARWMDVIDEATYLTQKQKEFMKDRCNELADEDMWLWN